MKLKKQLKPILIFLAIIIILVIAYLSYVYFTYNRIEDNISLEVTGDSAINTVTTNTTYTAITQNLGFGAYTPDFSFFMDGGTQSWAKSKDSVIDNINSSAALISNYSPDFIFLQEIDTDSTRSYHVNQADLLDNVFKNYDNVFATNYHSAFLMYPLYQPHGKSNSGILTYSKVNITSSVRRQLEISSGFSRFIDLDRCYTVSRIDVDNGKELVIYNIHSSAYGGSEVIRTSQMTMLLNDMKKEYDKGNYCLCGGDFNHDFTGDSVEKINGVDTQKFDWAAPFPANLLPEGIIRCIDYSTDELVPTSRNCDKPYETGDYTVIIDGFIVSENIEVTYLENIQAGFKYSDHNPVLISFQLKP